MRKFAAASLIFFQFVRSTVAAADPAPPDAAANAAPVAGAPALPDRPSEQLVWKWSRFSTADYVITAAGGATTLAMAIVKPRTQALISGPILFDEAARNALRPEDLQTRYAFRDASDVGVALAVTWPFFVDSLITAWWYRGSRDVAQEMALIDLETLAVAGAAQGITNVVVGRERPYGRDCGTAELPATALDCTGSTRFRSFYSGHSTMSFAGAALICMHHFQNGLLGAPWDAVSCAGGYAVAAATATFRVVSDVHYASDAITGALVGTLIGYGIPLLHYRVDEKGRTGAMTWQLLPAGTGVRLLGAF